MRQNFLRAAHTLLSGPKKGDKVVVALSGGVDSAVAAKLLAEQDYDLSAVFMRNWDSADESGSDLTGCEWKKDWEIVQLTCKKLDLPLELIDLSAEYWNRVFEPALHDWQLGFNPNPDVWCNRHIKFGSLLDRVQARFNNTWLATGHYARIDSLRLASGAVRYRLLKAQDGHKDQSYFLSSVTDSSLSKVLFPLGKFHKSEVRVLAERWGLPSADRKESMGLCFVGKKRKFADFVSSYIPPKSGAIVDHITNAQLGVHNGLWNYTVGQGAKLRGMPTQMYVARKDTEKNELRLVPGSNHPALQAKFVHCAHWDWIWPNTPHEETLTQIGLPVMVRLGRNWKEAPCLLRYSPEDHRAVIEFQEPVLAAAPGQVAVAWLEEWCLGCGTITSAETLA